MNSIWKFELAETKEQLLFMPTGAIPLSVQVQNGIPYLWALVDTDKAREHRRVLIRGTGDDAFECTREHFVDTFQMEGGKLVFHVFMW